MDRNLQKKSRIFFIYKSNRKRLEKNFNMKNKGAVKHTILESIENIF